MPYIPKNRIQTNLYTAGEEFYSPGVNPNYIGYYYKLYTGEYFTGKNPDDKPNNTLLLIEEYNIPEPKIKNKVSIVNNLENLTYGILSGTDLNFTTSTPQLFFTQPTEQDYQLGEFRRYFCKKRNEFTYLEISQSDYDNLVQQSPTINFKMWAPFNIPWTLTGEEKQVYYINRNIVLLKEKNEKYYGLGKYLQEKYLRYYKP